MGLHSGKTTCKETFNLPELCTLGRFTLPCCPCCRCSTALKSANVSANEKVQGVLIGAVCSVSKRLALHCIATPVLPLQRVFPHTMHPKQDRKLHSGLRQGQATRLSACRPAQRPATEWGRHTAAPNALKTGHFKETFTECHNLPTRYDTKKMQWPLLQGQAMCLSAHRLAQRAATRVGAGHFRPPMH